MKNGLLRASLLMVMMLGAHLHADKKKAAAQPACPMGKKNIEIMVYNTSGRPVNVDVYSKGFSKAVGDWEDLEMQGAAPDIVVGARDVKPEQAVRLMGSFVPGDEYEIDAYATKGNMHKTIRKAMVTFPSTCTHLTAQISDSGIKVSDQSSATPTSATPRAPQHEQAAPRSGRRRNG